MYVINTEREDVALMLNIENYDARYDDDFKDNYILLILTFFI